MGNYSAAEENSVNEDSFEDDFTQKLLKNNEMKDDKQIVKSAALNDKYNLIERPRFLLQFDLKE